jgi:ubiquinone/menaquinone biosynthesis C-methylase UbiE
MGGGPRHHHGPPHQHDQHQHHFIPAMGHAALLPLYDPFLRYVVREQTFKRRLVDHLGLGRGSRVLDVGCGTGTLAILLAAARPGVTVLAIDPDASVLERARTRAAAAGAVIAFAAGSATALPYADGSFDRVTSTLMAHHLSTAEKAAMFAEIRRVLAPAGELHLVDAGPARSRLGRALQRLLKPRVLRIAS